MVLSKQNKNMASFMDTDSCYLFKNRMFLVILSKLFHFPIWRKEQNKHGNSFKFCCSQGTNVEANNVQGEAITECNCRRKDVCSSGIILRSYLRYLLTFIGFLFARLSFYCTDLNHNQCQGSHWTIILWAWNTIFLL